MTDVHINVVIHFNARTIAAQKVMLQSLLEHEQTKSTRQAIDRLRETIAVQEALLNNRKRTVA